MKRCTRNKNKEEKMKMCRSVTKTKPNYSWADLDLNLLGEIKKKLYWGDHARFSGVCKNWLAAGHEKRPADVLPSVMLLFQEAVVGKVSYDLYQPLNLDQPIISRCIYLNQFFDLSRIGIPKSILYHDGCLFLSMSDTDYASTHFLLVTIRAERATTLPQFIHPVVPVEHNFVVLKAVSTYPFSPDCVFLALHVADHRHWSIGIFRHGDTQWTIFNFHFVEPFARPYSQKPVFIEGTFYFLCYDNRLASYDIASGDLKVESFSTPLYYGGIKKFFQLNGELMLFFYDIQVRKCFLSSYDWSQKLWVPIKTLGGCSLFLSNQSVYVDTLNYYQVSHNKIYYQEHDTCCVYSFENGQLLKSTSSGLRYWDGLDYPSECSLWVESPDLLSK